MLNIISHDGCRIQTSITINKKQAFLLFLNSIILFLFLMVQSHQSSLCLFYLLIRMPPLLVFQKSHWAVVHITGAKVIPKF